jgi:putative cardiolipin synthase
LNTEMGLLIDSPALAGRLTATFDRASPELAYQVTLADDGTLRWHDGAISLDRASPKSGGRGCCWSASFRG